MDGEVGLGLRGVRAVSRIVTSRWVLLHGMVGIQARESPGVSAVQKLLLLVALDLFIERLANAVRLNSSCKRKAA